MIGAPNGWDWQLMPFLSMLPGDKLLIIEIVETMNMQKSKVSE